MISLILLRTSLIWCFKLSLLNLLYSGIKQPCHACNTTRVWHNTRVTHTKYKNASKSSSQRMLCTKLSFQIFTCRFMLHRINEYKSKLTFSHFLLINSSIFLCIWESERHWHVWELKNAIVLLTQYNFVVHFSRSSHCEHKHY